jgi:hypothetical protein
MACAPCRVARGIARTRHRPASLHTISTSRRLQSRCAVRSRFGCTAAQGNEQCENRGPSRSHERTENQLRIPASNIVSPKHRWSHRRAGRLRGVAWRGIDRAKFVSAQRFPRPNFREDKGARDCYKYLILVATPAGVPEAKNAKALDCQTSPKTRIEPKGLFPAVANHAGSA